MEALRQWAFAICCAMVACGMAQILLPKSNMEKMFKLCVSVFFLCCLLSPILLQNPQLRIQVQEYSQEDIQRRAEQLAGVVEQQAEQSAARSVEKFVADKLQEKGINYRSITIHISTSGQHGEEIPTADITLDRAYETQHETLLGELEAELGLDVRLGYA